MFNVSFFSAISYEIFKMPLGHSALTLSCRKSLSYKNQSIDLRSKSIDWFLYDNGLRHERVKKAEVYFDWLKQCNCHFLGIYLQDDNQDLLYSKNIVERETWKRILYVNPSIRLETDVAFPLCSLSAFCKYMFGLVFGLCFLKFVFSLSNRQWKCQEFLVQNAGIMWGMSGICDLRLDWQPWTLWF